MGNKSSFKKKQKAFKTRHSTKGSIKAANKGRIDASDGVTKRAPKHQMSRAERRNQTNQMRLQKQKQRMEDTKIFSGRYSVPRNVALVPLTGDIDTVAVAEKFATVLGGTPEHEGVLNVAKFHQRLRFFPTKYAAFFDVLDAAKAADFVIFLLSANEEISDYGEQIMRCITMQGVSTTLGMMWGTNKEAREKDVRSSLTSWFGHFFPDERLYSVENDSEVSVAGRILCQKAPKGLHWRDERPYIVAEEAQVSGLELVVNGFVRGRGLSPDMYMHVPGYGDYKIAQITEIKEESQVWSNNEDATVSRLVPVDEQVDLDSDDDDERLEGQGVRIDGHTDVTGLIEAGVTDLGPQQAKHVPEGTSDYQKAWFLEGEDYRSDSDDENGVLTDEEGDLVAENVQTEELDDAMEDEQDEDEEEAEEEEEGDDDMAEDDFDSAGLSKEMAREAKDDLEFPDEIELDPRESAKKRLHRYRGVRSIRHTAWNARERDPRAPEEYARLYRPGDVIATRNRKEKLLEAGAAVGTKVSVHLVATPESAQAVAEQTISSGRISNPVTVYGLLPGEEKYGYVNASLTMDSEVVDPIKSKESIIVQYGPRRMLVNPLFSQGGHSDNQVYKFNRYLHPGRAAVATFIAPITLSHAPVVFYRTKFQNEQIVLGSGTVQDCDANRIIVKMAVLTGLPVKIHRKLVTVRHMFFSREDVEWFRSVPLFTKLGAQGYIKESLGTHGLFKATFDKKIKSEDTIALPLYKRVWPKFAKPSPV